MKIEQSPAMLYAEIYVRLLLLKRKAISSPEILPFIRRYNIFQKPPQILVAVEV